MCVKDLLLFFSVLILRLTLLTLIMSASPSSKKWKPWKGLSTREMFCIFQCIGKFNELCDQKYSFINLRWNDENLVWYRQKTENMVSFTSDLFCFLLSGIKIISVLKQELIRSCLNEGQRDFMDAHLVLCGQFGGQLVMKFYPSKWKLHLLWVRDMHCWLMHNHVLNSIQLWDWTWCHFQGG